MPPKGNLLKEYNDDMSEEVLKRATAATMKADCVRMKASKTRPYFSSAIWNLQPVPTPGLSGYGLPTPMAVDMYGRWYYDPEVMETVSLEYLVNFLFHEIMHLLFKHNDRAERAHAQPFLWNIAGDAVINNNIREDQLKLPDYLVFPQDFGAPPGELEEVYYRLLARKYPEIAAQDYDPSGGDQGSEGSDSDGDGDGDGQPSPGGGRSTRPSTGDGSRASSGSSTDPSGPARDRKGSGGAQQKLEDILNGDHTPCGSCATGKQEPWELGPPSDAHPALQPGEWEAVRQDVAAKIDAHAKSRGTVPAGLQRWANGFLKPKGNWKTILRAAIRGAISQASGDDDHTYASINRRSDSFGEFLFPAMIAYKPRIGVVVDTSGSMGDDELSQAVAEIRGVIKTSQCEDGLSVLACDAAVYECKKVFKPELVSLQGGGGTDMGLGIQHYIQKRQRPDIVIVLTDAMTPWPEKKPPFKLVIGRMNGTGVIPPYADRVVEIDTSDIREKIFADR